MSEFPVSPADLVRFIVDLVFLLLGVVIGVIADRKKFQYQTKSESKTELVASIYRAVGAFPSLETAIRNYRLSEDQFGQLRHFADLINQANSLVKALGVESKNLSGEVEELIKRMDLLGNRLLKCKRASTTETLKSIADEGAKMMSDARSLTDMLRSEFQKKRYIIF